MSDTSIGVMLYNKDEDSKQKFRDLDWLKRNIFCNDIWKNNKSVLDIGCGNGRVNKLYKNYFSKIVCVDPFVNISTKYRYSVVESFKIKFEDFEYKDKFDIIVFIFSLYLFENKERIIEKCLTFLKDIGKIIIIDGREWADIQKKGKGAININLICTQFNLTKEEIIERDSIYTEFEYYFGILRR